MNSIGKWLVNARPTALVQSLMPAVLAVILAIGLPGFNLCLGLLAIIGVAFAHLAMNLADDYFDYKADMHSDRDRVIRRGFRAMTGKYTYLTDGSANLKSTLKVIVLFLFIAALCGGIIVAYYFFNGNFTGKDGYWWIFAIALTTLFLGIFYSAPPLKLAYRGLGELEIGIIFGPLLMMGIFYSTCGCMNSSIVITSIPVGLLVLNILYTHSFIERAGDAESNKMTLARLLGSDKACMAAACIINFLPFLAILIGVIAGLLAPLYLLVLLVLPRAIWLCRSLKEFNEGKVDVPEKAPAYTGISDKDMAKYHESGVDWFMMRWLCARNLLSGFCLLLIIIKLITLFI